jgi:hypothetical protein
MGEHGIVWHQQAGVVKIRLIAVDGNSANGSYDREAGTTALHLVSAWASEHRLVLHKPKCKINPTKSLQF